MKLKLFKEAISEIRKKFSPEFINRIDKIAIFESLKENELHKITRRLLSKLGERAGKIGISLSFDDSVISEICKISETEKYGARALKRTITEYAENLVSEKIISGEITSGDEVLLTFSESGFDAKILSANV